jgi:hypothetical protein
MRRLLVIGLLLCGGLAGALTGQERSARQWLAPIDRDTPAGEMLDRLWKALQALSESERALRERQDVHERRIELLERETRELREELEQLRRARR